LVLAAGLLKADRIHAEMMRPPTHVITLATAKISPTNRYACFISSATEALSRRIPQTITSTAGQIAQDQRGNPANPSKKAIARSANSAMLTSWAVIGDTRAGGLAPATPIASADPGTNLMLSAGLIHTKPMPLPSEHPRSRVGRWSLIGHASGSVWRRGVARPRLVEAPSSAESSPGLPRGYLCDQDSALRSPRLHPVGSGSRHARRRAVGARRRDDCPM